MGDVALCILLFSSADRKSECFSPLPPLTSSMVVFEWCFSLFFAENGLGSVVSDVLVGWLAFRLLPVEQYGKSYC